MTLIMVWQERETNRAWMVSDSRLSGPKTPTGGYVQYTDRAAKILEAPIILNPLQPDEPILARTTLGFAYCGSSLVALNA